MEHILEQLYFGNLIANERDIRRGSELAKAYKAFSEAEELLSAKLTGDEKRALLALLDAHSEILGTSECEGFCRGFRLGTLLLMDVLAGAGELFEGGIDP